MLILGGDGAGGAGNRLGYYKEDAKGVLFCYSDLLSRLIIDPFFRQHARFNLHMKLEASVSQELKGCVPFLPERG